MTGKGPQVRVATSNPMKVAAVRKAFARFWRGAKVSGVKAASGVSAQPVSFGEIVRGARARARGALGECDFAVGIEAGLFRIASASPRPFQITIACVTDGTEESLGAGPFFELPERMVRAIVRSDTGSVAKVTKGKVTREDVTRDAVVMALAPFVSRPLYL